MIEVESLAEVEGQLTRTIAVGVGPWCVDKKDALNTKADMNWLKEEDLDKLEEIMNWCGEKYKKQYDAIISEHIQRYGVEEADSYRKWFDVRLSFKNPNAALEFKMVWG